MSFEFAVDNEVHMSNARYVEVDAHEFDLFMKDLGFNRSVAMHEVLYTKSHSDNASLQCKVYSSVRVGESVARERGKDRVRVVGIYDDGARSFGIYKGVGINRTTSQESIQERVEQRIRDCFERFEGWLAEQGEATSETLSVAAAKAAPKAPKVALQQIPAGSEFYPCELNEELELTLKCTKLTPWQGKTVATFRTREGHMFVYFTTGDTELQEHEIYDFTFTVIGKNVFKGSKQVVMGNPTGERVIR